MGQRATRRGLQPLFMLIAMIATAASAHAEQVFMPFACEARGGEVRLTPSYRHAYQIYGRREHHVFTVCSPVDHSRCRNWLIHRFDVDCGGERVSWLEVADAARRYMRADGFVEAGKMHLRMGPQWSAGQAADRRRPAEAPGEGGYDARGPADEIIDLPPGFAPAFGLPISFEGGSGPSNSFDAVEGPPPRPEPYDDSARWPDEDAYTPRGERRYAQGSPDDARDSGWGDSTYTTQVPAASERAVPLDPPVRKPAPNVQSAPPMEKVREPEKHDSSSAAAPSQKSGSVAGSSSVKSVQADKNVAAKSETPKIEAPKPMPAAKPAAPKMETSPADTAKPASPPQSQSGPVAPTILNAPGAAKPAAAETHAAPIEPAPAAAAPSAPAPEKPASPAPPPQASGEPHPAAADAPAKTEKTETAIPVIGLPSPSDSDQGRFIFTPLHWLLATGAAALLAAMAWVFMGRNRGFDAGMSRDLSSISLSGGLLANTSLVPVPESAPPAPVVEDNGPASPPIPPKTEVRMPTTLPEALEVLGASADAEPSVLKKIVEGLRQSWHPDLARSNRDRRYREQRMAQINVAWDIIEASLRPAA